MASLLSIIPLYGRTNKVVASRPSYFLPRFASTRSRLSVGYTDDLVGSRISLFCRSVMVRLCLEVKKLCVMDDLDHERSEQTIHDMRTGFAADLDVRCNVAYLAAG